MDVPVHTEWRELGGPAELAHRHGTHGLTLVPTATLPAGAPLAEAQTEFRSSPFNPQHARAQASSCTQQQWLVEPQLSRWLPAVLSMSLPHQFSGLLAQQGPTEGSPAPAHAPDPIPVPTGVEATLLSVRTTL